jgi:hypothetical protein
MANHGPATENEEVVPSDPKSRIRLKQCIAPFVFGGIFNREEGFPLVADFLFKFDDGRTLDDTCRRKGLTQSPA